MFCTKAQGIKQNDLGISRLEYSDGDFNTEKEKKFQYVVQTLETVAWWNISKKSIKERKPLVAHYVKIDFCQIVDSGNIKYWFISKEQNIVICEICNEFFFFS